MGFAEVLLELPLPPQPLLEAGVRGNCSSLLGVVDDEVGVGKADVKVTDETCPIMGEEPSIMGEFRFFIWPPELGFVKMVPACVDE